MTAKTKFLLLCLGVATTNSVAVLSEREIKKLAFIVEAVESEYPNISFHMRVKLNPIELKTLNEMLPKRLRCRYRAYNTAAVATDDLCKGLEKLGLK